MMRRLGHVLGWLAGLLLLCAGNAQAVSLGKIEVASHLGEPFYAEVPIFLDTGEDISRVYVEIADPMDYRILEVYRDPAVNLIRADVESDGRGARVKLSSRSAVDAPFFNLVLKTRYDRATHFKKYPIFLDLPKSITPVAARQKSAAGIDAQASAAANEKMTTAKQAGSSASSAQTAALQASRATSGAHAFTPFDGWARIGRYGPMVYGDTITTVARRLRIDDRFTLQQVMVALFEKNRDKFEKDNINLIRAGTYLDVPLASEVARISPSEARRVIAEHEKRWKELIKQPRYAAVAEAQRTRYSKRVRIGKRATGVAKAPLAASEQEAPSGERASKEAAEAGSAEKSGEGAEKAAAGADELAALKQQHEALQARLKEREQELAALRNKPADAELAAAQARIKKLELKLARLQAELDSAREQAIAARQGETSWLTWLLGALVVALLGVVGVLLRRERAHPAEASGIAQGPDSGGAIAESIPEIEVEEVDAESAKKQADEEAESSRMTAEEEREFTDSIPDLTDEDTGSMPAFGEEIEEEPDPNVDYVSEAEVYLRYGMEEEALQQLEMALRLKPDNVDALIKKVEILHSQGNNEAVDEVAAKAREMLQGADLERFNHAVNALKQGKGGGGPEVSLEDTLPQAKATDLMGGTMAGAAAAATAAAAGAAEESMDASATDDLGLGDVEIDLDLGEASEEGGAVETTEGDRTIALDSTLSDLDGLELGGVEEEAAAQEEPAKPAAAEESMDASATDDLGLGDAEIDLDLGEASEEGGAVETIEGDRTIALDSTLSDLDGLELGGVEEEAAAQEEPAKPAAAEAESVESVQETPSRDESEAGLDFDLSDIELPESSEAVEESEGEQVSGTVDLDTTIAMDWSEDTSVEGERDALAGGDVADLEFESVDESAEEGAVQAEEKPSREGAREQAASEEDADVGEASLDLGEGDLDAGFDLSDVEVEPADDFTSTIRTSLDQAEEGESDFTATGGFDLQLEEDAADSEASVGDEASAQRKAQPSPSEEQDDASMDEIALDLDLDDDATIQLDRLLSELSDEDEKKDDKR